MKYAIRKIIAIMIGFSLVATQTIVAADTNAAAQATDDKGIPIPEPNYDNFEDDNPQDPSHGKCTILSAKLFYPVGDTNGKTVLTKKEVTRICEIEKKVQGKCLKWEEKKEQYSLPNVYYNAYESNAYQDTIGSLMVALGAYDQIEHLWSGWHGFCYIGTLVDFSWAKDPMFWASLAASVILEGSEPGKFLDGTSIGNSVQSMEESIATTFGEFSENFGGNVVTKGAQQAGAAAAAETYSKFIEQGSGTLTSDQIKTITDAASAAYGEYILGVGECLLASGFNMASAVYQFAVDDGSELDCDPVDEVCNEEKNDMDDYEQDIMTVDEVAFDDMIQEYTDAYAQGKTDINIYDYIEEIKRENGVVTFRFKKMNEIPDAKVGDLNNDKMKDIMNTMKMIKLSITMGVEALKIAACAGGYQKGSISVPSKKDAPAFSAKNGLKMAISMAGKYLGPYGPLISAALQVVLEVLTSFKDVDTCHDEDDAVDAGKRHERTNYALQFNLCHFVKKKCIDKSWTLSNFWGNKCILHGYYYCCYDQILTKILVEQLKAELGRDWTHCTGITLRDLNYVSFRQCTDYEMQHGTDGAEENLPEGYDPKTAFQYKYKCMDLTEFKNYLKSELGSDIDLAHFDDFFKDLEGQI